MLFHWVISVEFIISLGRPLSYRLLHTACMKMRNHADVIHNRSHTVMLFGQSKLIQTAEGKLELKGATKEEQTEAKEYVSLFMHEAVMTITE